MQVIHSDCWPPGLQQLCLCDHFNLEIKFNLDLATLKVKIGKGSSIKVKLNALTWNGDFNGGNTGCGIITGEVNTLLWLCSC